MRSKNSGSDRPFPKLGQILAGVALAIALGLCACSHDGIPSDVQAVWDAYVTAAKSGDEAAARALWTAESAPFLELLAKDSLSLKSTTCRLIKANQFQEYTRLQVLVESRGVQEARFYYLVKQHDKYLFQYPFLLFASDWPILKSAHFTFHVSPAVDDLFAVEGSQNALLDTLPYEQFMAHLLRLTDLDLTQPIDYYLCPDTGVVSLLSGSKNAFRSQIGSCVITTRSNDFSEVAYTILLKQSDPIEFLRLGLCGYGETNRILLEGTTRATLSLYANYSKYLSRLTPDTLDLLLNLDKSDSPLRYSLGRMEQTTAAALVSDMIRCDSANRFATLYKGSHTADDFRRLFVNLYGEPPFAVLSRVNQQSTEYIAKMAPTVQSPGKAGTH